MAMPSGPVPASTPQKRPRDETDVENTPTSVKKLKLDALKDAASPSTPKALNAINSALTNVNGQAEVAPIPQPALTAPAITNSSNSVQPNPAAAAQAPLKFRPAIKLAALRGTIWDQGDSHKAAKLKKIASPRKRRQGRPRKEDFEATGGSVTETQKNTRADSPSGERDEYDVSHSDDGDSAQATPSKKKRGRPPKNASPAPKSILTPSKNRGPRPQKSVTFGEKSTREVFFEDLRKTTPGKKPKSPRQPKEDKDEIKCEICSRGHSNPPNEIILCDNCDFAVHQDCYGVSEIPEGDWLCKSCDQEDVVKSLSVVASAGEETSQIAVSADIPDIPNFEHHLRAHQRVLLDRCSGRRKISLVGHEEACDKARQLVEQTIISGEGNSMLLIGARGSGKTTVSKT